MSEDKDGIVRRHPKFFGVFLFLLLYPPPIWIPIFNGVRLYNSIFHPPPGMVASFLTFPYIALATLSFVLEGGSQTTIIFGVAGILSYVVSWVSCSQNSPVFWDQRTAAERLAEDLELEAKYPRGSKAFTRKALSMISSAIKDIDKLRHTPPPVK